MRDSFIYKNRSNEVSGPVLRFNFNLDVVLQTLRSCEIQSLDLDKSVFRRGVI
eukprot:TRINITY_DN11353_c1_g1_i1.p3 TRINITY_DN11353_c1_g1~~TRINITY_DN11353_c1_g1_i1.p3  ORF type:complete len:53 (-),score=6.60 TRINITY_DN11353_c1_g1_i1:158-316(-)